MEPGGPGSCPLPWAPSDSHLEAGRPVGAEETNCPQIPQLSSGAGERKPEGVTVWVRNEIAAAVRCYKYSD